MHIGVITSGRNTFGNPAESVVPTLENRVVTGVETGVLTGRGCHSADTILYSYHLPVSTPVSTPVTTLVSRKA